MKKNSIAKIFAGLLVFLLSVSPIAAQTKPKPIIFAVLNDGKTVEPIALIDKGELTQASDGGDDTAEILAFTKSYYKPKTTYKLIFSGINAGTVTIKKSDPNAECSSNLAEVTTVSNTAKLGGNVMGLATSATISKTAKGFRRKPTPAERAEIEKLVRAEFTKQKVKASALKILRSHNLTALDVDGDGKAELVGSYWVETSKTSRALLFFIADKQKSGKYSFGHSEFKAMTQDEMMSGADIAALDNGVYSELLLDVFDYNGDNQAEIFTYVQGLEGSSFYAYKRDEGKWVRAFEGGNYHCGF
jgi:hypothetical protein